MNLTVPLIYPVHSLTLAARNETVRFPVYKTDRNLILFQGLLRIYFCQRKSVQDSAYKRCQISKCPRQMKDFPDFSAQNFLQSAIAAIRYQKLYIRLILQSHKA